MALVNAAVSKFTKYPENLDGYQEIDLHMIFDIKHGGKFRRKARLVVGRHKTNYPSSTTYSLVVS